MTVIVIALPLNRDPPHDHCCMVALHGTACHTQCEPAYFILPSFPPLWEVLALTS
ncbi:hypothetical protein BD560DRAFT_397010, partial [Blakeslea trispora]